MENNNQLRILVVTDFYKPAYIYGGPAVSVPSICEELVKIGSNVTVFTTNANGPKKNLDIQADQLHMVEGVAVWYFKVYWKIANFYPFFSPSLGKACLKIKNQFDIIYIIGDWTFPVFISAKIAKRENIPYVMSPHGSFMNWGKDDKILKKTIYLELFEREIINNSFCIHTTSLLEAQYLAKWKFKPPVKVIPNGIDLEKFDKTPARGLLRRSLGLPSTASLSLFVGRLQKIKRLDLLVDAFAFFAKKDENAHLVIVGNDQDGSGKTAKEQAIRLGLEKQIHFTGALTGKLLMEAFIDADVLLLISAHENFGMVVIEALTIGLPVILTRNVGLFNEVENANAGIVVPSDAKEIGFAWELLLSNPELRLLMGNNGKQLVRNKFSSDVVAKSMLEIFDSMVVKKLANSNKHRDKN